MLQIVKVKTLGPTDTKGCRLAVYIGTSHFYYSRSVELNLDEDRVRCAKDAMKARGYAPHRLMIGGWDDKMRDVITFVAYPGQIGSARTAKAMMKHSNGIQDRDWFYY